MGRAARWLRGLLGGRRSDPAPEPREKKPRWGFGKSFREKEKEKEKEKPRAPPRPPPYPAAAAAAGGGGGGDEQSKRAIAVAAATAAVAEAAVAAAQAAAAVVRLTSSGRCAGAAVAAAGRREECAAVRIQAAFRGYLARRARKALRGLVKLQALVRGNIVRKQAAETLRCMHALVRVQARARACRALRSERSRPTDKPSRSNPGPPTPEKYEQGARTNGSKSDRSGSFKRNSSNRSHSSGSNWLDRWMDEKYGNSRAELNPRTGIGAATDDERTAKILEVDPGKPQFNLKRRVGASHLHSSSSAHTSEQNTRSFATVPGSPSKDSTTAQLSTPSPSSVGMRHSLTPLEYPLDPAEFGESPHFYSATSRPGSSRRGAFTPSKSECSRSLFGGYPDYPNYMATTESSKAKARSQSAPKQRPEFEKSGSVKKLSPYGAAQQQQQQHHHHHQKSASLQAKFANKAYPGSGRLDRLGMPVKY